MANLTTDHANSVTALDDQVDRLVGRVRDFRQGVIVGTSDELAEEIQALNGRMDAEERAMYLAAARTSRRPVPCLIFDFDKRLYLRGRHFLEREMDFDNEMAFVRDSDGSYFTSDGEMAIRAPNKLRYDHDPYSGEALGVLVEGGSTNILQNSEVFAEDSAWNRENVSVVASSIKPPLPSGTSYEISSTSTSAFKALRQVSTSAGPGWTASIFVKKVSGTRDTVRMSYSGSDGSGPAAEFNIVTGAIGDTNPDLIAHAPQRLKNGWWRLSITFGNLYSGGQVKFCWIDPVGSVTSDMVVAAFGAQLEDKDHATSYIRSLGSPATRNSDNPEYMLQTSLNSSAGSVYMEFRSNNLPSNSFFYALMAGGGNREISAYINSAGRVLASPISSANDIISAGEWIKFGYSFDVEGATCAVDGDSIGTEVSKSISPREFDRIRIGRQIGSGDGAFGMLHGHVRRFYYYPKRLTAAELEDITNG